MGWAAGVALVILPETAIFSMPIVPSIEQLSSVAERALARGVRELLPLRRSRHGHLRAVGCVLLFGRWRSLRIPIFTEPLLANPSCGITLPRSRGIFHSLLDHQIFTFSQVRLNGPLPGATSVVSPSTLRPDAITCAAPTGTRLAPIFGQSARRSLHLVRRIGSRTRRSKIFGCHPQMLSGFGKSLVGLLCRSLDHLSVRLEELHRRELGRSELGMHHVDRDFDVDHLPVLDHLEGHDVRIRFRDTRVLIGMLFEGMERCPAGDD